MDINKAFSDIFARRVRRDERRARSRRMVYGYRHKETGEICDNLLVLPYVDLMTGRRCVEHLVLATSGDERKAMHGYEVVRLGVYYKDRLRIDFLRRPEVVCDCDIDSADKE